MSQTSTDLTHRRCVPCEGGVHKYSLKQAREQIELLPGWELSADGRSIAKNWTVRDFAAGIDFLNRVARLAVEEGHHPDLHLSNYREMRISLSTHAIEGLSDNDFILAAKIDQLPVDLKTSRPR